MITQAMFDFSNVVLSRRRKPFYSKRLRCWYFKDAAGKQYRLHPDQQRALEIWRSIMGPEPEPVIVPGIVTTRPPKPPTKPKPSPKRPKVRDLEASRMQLKTVRILKLIDLLASFRFPKRLEEIHALITDAMGGDWHPRTTERDLYVIESLGMLEVSSCGFKLNLVTSERMQTAALAIFG